MEDVTEVAEKQRRHTAASVVASVLVLVVAQYNDDDHFTLRGRRTWPLLHAELRCRMMIISS